MGRDDVQFQKVKFYFVYCIKTFNLKGHDDELMIGELFFNII